MRFGIALSMVTAASTSRTSPAAERHSAQVMVLRSSSHYSIFFSSPISERLFPPSKNPLATDKYL
jgi:hypothetical protein